MNRRLLLFLILVAVTSSFFVKPAYYAIRYPVIEELASNDINISNEPVQTSTKRELFSVLDKEGKTVTLIPVADYEIWARVIINETYPNFWNVDRGLDNLLTNDLVLVWGRLSEERYLKKIKFSHQWTYMTFKYTDEELNRDLGYEYIPNHVSSNHLIAANKNIDHALRRLQKNDTVRIQGYLVNIQIPGQPIIQTSTVRTDNWRAGQGNTGGSEFIYVTKLQKENKLYK